jgi:hypothetical protein
MHLNRSANAWTIWQEEHTTSQRDSVESLQQSWWSDRSTRIASFLQFFMAADYPKFRVKAAINLPQFLVIRDCHRREIYFG